MKWNDSFHPYAAITGGTIILSGILMFNFGGKIYGSLHPLIHKKPSAE